MCQNLEFKAEQYKLYPFAHLADFPEVYIPRLSNVPKVSDWHSLFLYHEHSLGPRVDYELCFYENMFD